MGLADNFSGWSLPHPAALLSGVIAILFAPFVFTYLNSPVRSIPGPLVARFSDLWRLYLVWMRSPEKEHYALHKTYGSAVVLGPNMVSINDPELIKIIYSRKNILIKSDFYTVSDFMVAGRRVEHPFSTRDEQLNSRGMKPIQRLWALNRILETGKACNMDRWLHFFAYDVIGYATFSHRLGFMEEEHDVGNMIANSEGHNAYLSVIGMMPFLDLLLLKNPIFPIGPSGQGAAVAVCTRVIDERKRGVDGHTPQATPDFLDNYLAVQRNDLENVPDDMVLMWMLTNVQAGSDTVAAILRSCVYYLACNQNKLRKLQAELDAGRVQVPLSWERSQTLPYLDACVREGIRLGPAIPFPLERVVGPNGLRLSDGKMLSPGTIVGVNPWVMNRNTEIYGKDAESYRPERWLQAGDENSRDYAARLGLMRECDISFGEGKRACPGQWMSFVETYKLVGSLCRTYNFVFAPDGRPYKTTNRWFMGQEGLDLMLERRLD